MQEPSNPLADARTALAAASTAPPDLAAIYAAAARNALERAREDLRHVEAALIARERELVHRAAPRQRELPITHEGD